MAFKKAILYKFTILVLNMSVKVFKLKIGDFFIFAAIILIAIFCLVCLNRNSNIVTVSWEGENLYTIDLRDPENEGREFPVYSNKYTLLLRVEDEKISVVKTNCPDQICLHTPAVGKDGGVICCVPAGIIIIAQNGQSDWDVVIN